MLFQSLWVSFTQPITVALPVTIPLPEARSHIRLPILSQHGLPLISAVFPSSNMRSSHSGKMQRMLSLLPMVTLLQQ